MTKLYDNSPVTAVMWFFPLFFEAIARLPTPEARPVDSAEKANTGAGRTWCRVPCINVKTSPSASRRPFFFVCMYARFFPQWSAMPRINVVYNERIASSAVGQPCNSILIYGVGSSFATAPLSVVLTVPSYCPHCSWFISSRTQSRMFR